MNYPDTYLTIKKAKILCDLLSDEFLEEIKSLIEKDTPIPIGFRKETENGGVISECYICPRCEKDIYEEEQRYCDFCGQRLKWGE